LNRANVIPCISVSALVLVQGVAAADSIVPGTFTARATVASLLQRDLVTPVEELNDDMTITDPLQDLTVNQHLGNFSGIFPYITNSGWRNASQYPTGFSEHTVSRLWTGAEGNETYLNATNQVQVERTFTILDGPGPEVSCSFSYSPQGAYNSGTYGPTVNPLHTRGVEFYLERIGGEILVDQRFSTSGPVTQVPSSTWIIPAMQPLAPGEYRVRVASWAAWEATAQNGRGWSQSSVGFSVGIVPTPSALALLCGGFVVIGRRRRAVVAK